MCRSIVKILSIISASLLILGMGAISKAEAAGCYNVSYEVCGAYNGAYCNPGDTDTGTTSKLCGNGEYTHTIRCCPPSGGGGVNGACGSAHGSNPDSSPTTGLCAAGTASAVSGTTMLNAWTWTCQGSGGGTTASCNTAPSAGCHDTFEVKTCCPVETSGSDCPAGQGAKKAFFGSPPSGNPCRICSASAPVVDGACGASAGTCSTGTVSGDNGATACGTTRTWTCSGSGGGTNASCSKANAACAGGCYPDFNVYFGWSCPGPTESINVTCPAGQGASQAAYGSHIAPAVCNQQPSAAAWRTSECRACGSPPVNGSCSSTAGACSSGTPTGDNGLTSCGTTRTWTCSGSGGGSNASCSNVNPACEPVVLGRCGAANGAPYSSAPTFGLCRSGTASAISGSGPWTWTCNGSGGGPTASCSTASMGTACKARKVSTQDGNSCVITADGGVKCWGNDYGAIPATVAGLTDVIDIKSSPFANCAFIKDGAIKCWGRPVGFPPTGTPHVSMTPQPLSTFVSGLPGNIVDIELNLDSACVQTASGDAKCWGGNFFSQLGDGTRTDRSTPVDVQGSSGNTSKIAGGVNPTSASGCMLAKEGSVKCWGMNNNGQVGDGTTTRRDAPVGVTGLASGVKDIVAGSQSNCAVTDTGNVKCWGDPPFFDAAVPQWTPVSIAALANVTKISGGFPSTTYCALTSSGGVKCFGSDFMGALGDGGSSTNNSFLAAVDVVGLGSGVVDISTARSGASETHSCAVTNAGDVKCWGGNTVSQLGTGSNSPSNTYAPVSADLCPAINGACGSADGVGVTSAPSSNLCSTGTATSVSGSGPWGWACNGSGGGTNASCSAPLKINGACGSANGVGTTSAPSSGLCSAGTASSVSGSGPFSWTCSGANGGSNASCSAPLMMNGACGSSHGGSFYSAPSSNLCAAGAASAVSGSGPYSWTCTGSNGGSTANCSAVRKVDGVCGTANGVGNENMPTALCSSGNPSGVSTVGTNWNWSCGGVNGGTNMNCAAPRIYHGLCGPANGTNVYAKPSSGLCAVGNATAVIGAGPFDWNCNGINGGNNVSCSANLTVNGQCGPAHGQFSMSAPTSGLCSAGTATAVAGTGPYTWSCNGVNGGTASACASQAIVNGKCGSSNNMPTASAPVSGLCSAGTASAVAGSGPWTWSCNGSGGGSKSNCTAPTPPPPPSFGGACPGP